MWCRSFDISGQEMEDRYTDNILLIMIKRCIGPVEVIFREESDSSDTTSNANDTKKKDRIVLMPFFQRKCVCSLSVNAYHRILCELCTLISNYISEELIYTKMFT